MNQDDIKARVERARELDKKATKGPWKWAEKEINKDARERAKMRKRRTKPKNEMVYALLGPIHGHAIYPEGHPDYWRIHDLWDHHQVAYLHWHAMKRDMAIGVVPSDADCAFIAESRTLLPALAADCERLQARVAELEAAARIDDSLEATAQRLIGAAHAYWKKLGSEIGQRAVIWLEDTSGRLVIFTRGEYREQLMRNIGLINRPHYFAKTGPEQED